MQYLIFSDIHGNLPAFEKMLKAEPAVNGFISLGDVVNYGPWSNECVDLLESLPATRLKGNHEEDFLSGQYPGKSELVKLFFNICIRDFTREKQIRRYQESIQLGNYKCVHTINNAYIYPDSVIEVSGNYFIGHSHHQFDRQGENFHVINVGSVGQNRKEIDVINYALFDPDNGKLELKSLTYDVDPVIQKMRALDYPKECIDYYMNKPRRT